MYLNLIVILATFLPPISVLMCDREDGRDATARIESTTKEELDGFHRYLKRRGQDTCAIDLP